LGVKAEINFFNQDGEWTGSCETIGNSEEELEDYARESVEDFFGDSYEISFTQD